MQTKTRPNPIDEICQKLSLAYLLADENDPEVQQKYADTELDVTQSPNELAAADCTEAEENLLEALLLWGGVEAWSFNVPATPDLEALSFAVLEEDAATGADGAEQRLADAEARRVRATTDLTGAGAASARQEMVEFILADRVEVTACRGLLASISP